MIQILCGNQSILNILGKPKQSQSGYRYMHYSISEAVDDGVLLFHTLTRELILLSNEEFDNAMELPYLKEHWFVVPNDFNDKKQVEIVRWLQNTMGRKSDDIFSYTIYTTSDCNARCFYCFELGRPRIPMSDEVALKTAAYIKTHRGERTVNLRWFGGEPLYNERPIDLISEYLRKENIPFTARMTTNGYLFDDKMVKKAKELWNLKEVQISLDGPEEVYNRIKAFIYRDVNAYRIVTDNIQRLLDNKIAVVVRLNMDFYNIQDLNILSDELAKRFSYSPGFFIYVRLIIDEKTAWDKRYTDKQWTQLYQAKEDLEKKLTDLGVFTARSPRLSKYLGYMHCMVDNSKCIVISPIGQLGICEHFSEEGLIGDLDSDKLDQTVINTWRERCDEIDACSTCFYYPQCIRLKRCPYQRPCIELERKAFRNKLGLAMLNEYNLWRNDAQGTEQDEDEDLI